MMHRKNAWLLLGAALLWTAGCTFNLQRPAPPALHDFGSSTPGAEALRATWTAVTVAAPEWLQERRILYRLLYADPTQVRSYTLDRWLAPPPALLTQKLTQAGGGGSHRLQVELQELEQVFDRPGNACVVVTLRATLRDADADRPLGERLVQLRQATSAGNAAGAVDAFALAIDKATALLCEWSRTFGPGA